MQRDGSKMLINFQAELEEAARECERQIGSTYLPGHRASTPKQLLTLVHNNNRLAGADTERGGWQRSAYVFTLFPSTRKLDLHFGKTRVSCVCVCGCVCAGACVCNVLDQTESSVA